ncbi:MAG: helix-turn-helix transcriptional regulator [Bacilli bacterium]
MNLLKEIRKKNNYSMQHMANLLKISKTFYWQLETRNRRLSYDMAIKIAEIFLLKPDDLFYDYYKSKG